MGANRTFINNTIKSAEHHNRRVEEKGCWQEKAHEIRMEQKQKQMRRRKRGRESLGNKTEQDAAREFWAQQKRAKLAEDREKELELKKKKEAERLALKQAAEAKAARKAE